MNGFTEWRKETFGEDAYDKTLVKVVGITTAVGFISVVALGLLWA